MATLIGSVKVTPSQVAPGQSVQVQVLDPKGSPYTSDSDVIIALDGIPVPSRYYQFPTAGTRTIAVYAAGNGTTETTTAKVTVTGAPLTFHRTVLTPAQPAAPGQIPLITVTQDFTVPYQPTFSLSTPPATRAAAALALAAADKANEDKPAPAPPPGQTAPAGFTALMALFSNSAGEAPTAQHLLLPRPIDPPPPSGTSYNWTFGDGQIGARTDTPSVTHDFFPAITPGRVPFAFDVSCQIVHDQITVTRTLVLYSPYGMCQRNGTTVPYVIGDTYASLNSDKTSFSAMLIVYNIEATAITIDQMAIVPVWNSASARYPAFSFTKMAQPVSIGAHSVSMFGVQVLRSQLSGLAQGAAVTGFILAFQGTLAPPVIVGPTPPVVGRVATGPGLDVAVSNRLGLGPGSPVSLPGIGSPIRFSWNVQLQLQDQQLPEPVIVMPKGAPWLLNTLGKAPGIASTAVKSGGVAADPATGVVSVALASAAPTRAQAAQLRHSLLSVLNTANTATGAK
jgi:hypothetical protein